MTGRMPELLAPAGNAEALVCAVENGADAVYFGGRQFSARAFAGNFSDDKLIGAVDYCHLHGVRAYLTLNTLVTDRELEPLARFAAFASEAGVDAVIVQDVGAGKIIRAAAPSLPLHVSTQAGITDAAGAEFFRELGYTRAVLARELSEGDIKEIAAQTALELELFVHGAICVCYSGQCLMSSFIGGRSGNRGKCAQPCRLPYRAGTREGFLLSPKDMSLLGHLGAIGSMGVASLKIEGRMKGPQYVGTVVGLYRKYLDDPGPVSPEDEAALTAAFDRGGLTDGYFTGKPGPSMFCVRRPENPYRSQGALEKLPPRRLPLDAFFTAKTGAPPVLRLTDGTGRGALCHGAAPAEPAANAPLSPDSIRRQLEKLGDTHYFLRGLETDLDEGVYVPVAELNRLRREGVALLEREITASYRRSDSVPVTVLAEKRAQTEHLGFTAWVSTQEQLDAISGEIDFLHTLYLPLSLAARQKHLEGNMAVALDFRDGGSVISSLASLKAARVLVSNPGQLGPLRAMKTDIIIGERMNVFNSVCARSYPGSLWVCPSPELTLTQLGSLAPEVSIEVTAYGRTALMITKNPLAGQNALTDRTGAVFPVLPRGDGGSVLLNSQPVVMSDKLEDFKKSGVNLIRLSFTTESPGECREILRLFRAGGVYGGKLTRGKFYKGV